MIRTILIPLLALLGVLFGVYTVVQGSKPPVASLPVAEPPKAPFQSFVAGSGLIETNTQNIGVGTPTAGVVTKVAVVVGAIVKRGDVLFEIESRQLEAELEVRKAALAAATASVERLRAQPRAEEIPPAEAKVAEAVSLFDDAKSQLAFWDRITDKRAITEDDLSKRRFAVAAAEARLRAAQASLTLIKAGAWKSDILVAEAQAAQAEAQLKSTLIEIDRRVVRSPVDGQVLQVNIRAGEFAQAGPLATPLVMMGGVSPLHVRVDVDENEAWRVAAGAKAVGFLRGNKSISTPLTFVRFEPYVVPKRSLTGESTERVDTRVLQVIYSFERGSMPLYVGQQMDAYVEAPPLEAVSAAQAPTDKK